MIKNTSRFQIAIAAIDAENTEDPNVTFHKGRDVPKSLLYAIRMTERLDSFCPEASESLRLAARSQHIRRWEIPRNNYPMDRVGYLKWRTALKHFHADLARTLLENAGYDPATIAHVQSLLRKEKLKQDTDAQTLEDVICLVFLEHDFADFSKKHAEEKILGILRKTWKKMSSKAQKEALQLDLLPTTRAQVEKALQSPG